LYFAHIILAESSVDVKIETGKNDITEHPHYDQPSIGMFGFFDALFFAVIFLFVFHLYPVLIRCVCDM